mgnify:CR=1 FL=1
MAMISKKSLLIGLFFSSGISALAYEIVWVRWLTLLTGTTQHAASAVLAIFFTGLALGSFIAGKLASRLFKPILLYGLVEVSVGLWALASPLVVSYLDSLASSQAALFFWIVVFLLPPTVFLGTTFPLLVKALGMQYIPVLYSFNTLGAVVGVLAAGFFFPPLLGLSATVRIAGAMSVLVGLGALCIRNHEAVKETDLRTDSVTGNNSRLILLVLFFSGFAALALEVFWSKLLVLLMGGSIYTFSIVLMVYLAGIACGSGFVRRFGMKRTDVVLFVSFLAIGVGVVASLFFIDKLPFLLLGVLQKTASQFWLSTLIEAGIAGMVIVVPTLFMGISFPVAIALLGREGTKAAGYGYGVNTVGGVAGSLAAGFFLIPQLGLQRSIFAMGGVYLLLAAFLLVFMPGIRRVALAVISVFLAAGLFAPTWGREVLTSGVYINADSWVKNREASKLVFYKEGMYGTVTVRAFPDGVKILQINGKNEASSDFDADAASLIGHLALALKSDARKVLLIGLGGGFTLGALEDYDTDSIDVVEIEPAVVEAAKNMTDVNGDALSDSRVTVTIDDGRNFLKRGSASYDVIISQPSNVWISGVSSLFTREYYELAKKRLSEHGIVVAWIQLYGITPEDLQIAVRSFTSVFPHYESWTNLTGQDLLLIGSASRIERAKLKSPIKKHEIETREELEGYKLLDQSELTLLAGEGPMHTDDFPILEFSTPKSLYQNITAKNLELIYSLRKKRDDPWGRWRNFLLEAHTKQLEADLEGAQKAYVAALDVDTQNRQVARLLADVITARARKHVKEGNTEEALSAYIEAERAYPEGHIAARSRGELLLRQAKSGIGFYLPAVNEAEGEFVKALERAPWDFESHLNLGIVYGIYGNYALAEKEFKKAIEIHPASTLAWNNLAKAYFDQKKMGEAKNAWEESLKVDANQPEVRKALKRLP